jgi:hypothetical protein
MRPIFLAALLLVPGCSDDKPAAPTAAESDQLNEADSMLDSLANEEGPADRSTGPSNQAN